MPAARTTNPGPSSSIGVVSVLHVRANLGRLLAEVDSGRGSLIIEKRGAPKAVLLSLRDYVRLAAPEPEVLRLIGEDAERNGTSKLTSGQIDRIIKSSRTRKKKP
jgi:prevent-host-death family protein